MYSTAAKMAAGENDNAAMMFFLRPSGSRCSARPSAPDCGIILVHHTEET